MDYEGPSTKATRSEALRGEKAMRGEGVEGATDVNIRTLRISRENDDKTPQPLRRRRRRQLNLSINHLKEKPYSEQKEQEQ